MRMITDTRRQSPTSFSIEAKKHFCRFWNSHLMVVGLLIAILSSNNLIAQTQEPYCLHFDDLEIEAGESGTLEVYLYHLLPLGAFSLGFEIPEGWQTGTIEPGEAIESLLGGSSSPEFWLAGSASDPNQPNSNGVTVLCILTDSSSNPASLMPGIENSLVEVELTPPPGATLGSYEVAFRQALIPTGSVTNLPLDLVLVDPDGMEYSPNFGVELNNGIIEVIQTPAEKEFIRGDVDDSGHLNLTDAVNLLSWLFFGLYEPACHETGDINNDDNMNLVDPVQLLFYLFLNEIPPAQPTDECGVDPNPNDTLTCEEYQSCP